MANAVLDRAVVPRTYSWDDLVLMWQLGREYGHLEVATAVDEARSVPHWLPQAYTEAERRAARVANVPARDVNAWIREQRAAGWPSVRLPAHQAGHPGGAVAWDEAVVSRG